MFYLIFFVILFNSVQINKSASEQALIKELQHVSNSSKKLEILNTLSRKHLNSEPLKAISYGQNAATLAKNIQNKKEQAIALNNIGVAYAILGNYPKATQFYYEALQIRESIKDSAGIAASYNNLGNAYNIQNDLKKALEYYHKSLDINKKLRIKNISNKLINIGAVYQKLNQLDKSLKYHQEALALKNKLNDNTNLSELLNNIGILYANKNNLNKSLFYYKSALKVSTETNNQVVKGSVCTGIARAYLRLKQYDEALSYAHQSFEVANSTASDLEKLNSVHTLKDVYTAIGDYKQAFKYLELATQYQDSIYSQDKEKLIAEMHTKYETEQKETENKHLKAQQELNQRKLEKKTMIQYAIGILLALMAALAFVFFRGRQRVRAVNRQLLLKNEEISEKNKVISSKKDELEALNGLKDKLFSIVSHDLRGPLLSLKSLLEMVNMGALSDVELKDFIKVLETEQKNTLTLLDNLLIWAKTQMKGLEAKPACQNLHQLVEENIALLASQAQDKNLLLQNEVPSSLRVWADAEMIKLVLRNLISNAIKFCQPGDSIQVLASETDGQVVVSVKDSGVGISKENQAKLFQLGGYTTLGTDDEKGSGIGLMLCRDFIEKNQGSIWVESQPGKGAEFKFTLPGERNRYAEITQEAIGA